MPKVKNFRSSLSSSASAAPYAFVRSETQLFEDSAHDVSLVTSSASEYHPISSLSDTSAPIEFFIQSSDSQYFDLNETKLYLRARIVDSKGDPVKENVVVMPANNFLHTMFSQCSVYLNETLITPTMNLYPYKSYLETLLGFGKEFKKSQAQCALYYKEKNPSAINADEDGFKQRYQLTKQSKVFEMIGRPFSDVFLQNKYLIPGVDVRIQFQRSSAEFCLISVDDQKYRLEVQEARLLVLKHTLHPSLMVQHLKQLESGIPASYVMRKSEVKSYTLSPGTLQSVNENLLNSVLPDRVIIALVNSVNLMGSIQTNPFNFEHFGLKYIDVSVNGDQSTCMPIHLDWDNDKYIQVYHNLFAGLGIVNDDVGLEITREEYKTGYSVFCYDLRHMREGCIIPKHGNVKIELKFKSALQNAVSVLVYAEYAAQLQIDRNKNIYYKDFSIQN